MISFLKSKGMNSPRDRQDERWKVNPFLALGTIAAISGLTRDTVFLLVEKGVFNSLRNSDGKMLIKRAEVLKWLNEQSKQ